MAAIGAHLNGACLHADRALGLYCINFCINFKRYNL